MIDEEWKMSASVDEVRENLLPVTTIATVCEGVCVL